MLYLDAYNKMIDAPAALFDAYNCVTSFHQHIIESNAELLSANTHPVYANQIDVRANARALESITSQIEIDGYDGYGRCVYVAPAINYPDNTNSLVQISAKVNVGTADIYVFITEKYPNTSFKKLYNYATPVMTAGVGALFYRVGTTNIYGANAILPNSPSINRRCWMSIWVVGDKKSANQKFILGSVYWGQYPPDIVATSKSNWGESEEE